MKKILVTGAGSYIGTSFQNYMSQWPEEYQVDVLDMIGDAWREYDFSGYDSVFHVAGIAHSDNGTITEEKKALYYRVNTDLAVETAKKAKDSGVKQFVFMSSMIIYSGCEETVITKNTVPRSQNYYGDSKWQADQRVRSLIAEDFFVAVLRPPMIYGKGSKGNYPKLAKLAGMLPIFPVVKNRRSMLHIDNLCEFIRLVIDDCSSGVFFPQNNEYTVTSEMVRMIARAKGHRIVMIPGMTFPMALLQKTPGKIGNLARKAFGDLAYEMTMSEYPKNYRVCSLKESIEKTEC